MADSKFWLRTEKKFRGLQVPPPQPGEVQRAGHNGLCAWWTPDGSPDGGTYKFFDDGHDIEANGNIQRMFEAVAESAGVELGYPVGEAAVFGWLDCLRLGRLYVTPFLEGCLILNRVCDASAEYCLKCRTNAKAAARDRERAFEASVLSQAFLLDHSGLARREIPSQTQQSGDDATKDCKARRRAAVDRYIDEVLRKSGKRIWRTDIWRHARYKSRTEFERWERCDKKATKTAARRFTEILTQKPHLK